MSVNNRLWFVGLAVFCAVVALLAFHGFRGPQNETGGAPASARYAGSASCRECHAQAYEMWAASKHGLAERAVQARLDDVAFVPARSFKHGSQTTTVSGTDTGLFITSLGLSGQSETGAIARVIGVDPLRQFLAAAPGGRWQASEAAYDPNRNEWFNVFGEEDRRPGEWGHWTGRGMNWNSMCAACHNTALQKNYDVATDTYQTTMAERGVACEACHGPLQNHVDWQRRYHRAGAADPTLLRMTPPQTLDTCASCHSLRAEIDGNFKPGDKFNDHFDLSVVDDRDTFYPDGQVRGEDYEYSAFLGSKMHQAGVTCLDCHPRALHAPRLTGNALCLRCHATGLLKAPIIQPEVHSHHAAGSTGDDCAACHMPVTVYMQRHPRHDHGMTIPDPLLTMKYGIPNACNRCHTDQQAGWALAAVEKWFGTKMQRPTRERAEWIARARQGDAAARAPITALAADNRNPYWQAVAAGLLSQWLGETNVNQTLDHCLAEQDPLVRATAVRALRPVVEQGESGIKARVRQLLGDPCRNVRLSAAWVLEAELDTNSDIGREFLRSLDFNADQPVGQMRQGEFYFARGDLPEALGHYEQAVKWDANSAPMRRELAVCLSAENRAQEAREQLEAACRLSPQDAEYRYELGLACNEAGDLAKAIEALQASVRMDPRLPRAWYNLGLALEAGDQSAPALEALVRAESLAPDDARIPYARSTILAKTGKKQEARAAAQRALSLQPGYLEAAQLLESLPEK